MNYTFIESEVDLNYLNKELLKKPEVGIDTEFRRRSKDDLKLCSNKKDIEHLDHKQKILNCMI